MKPSEAIKPISYLKAHASEIVRNITETHKTLIITQNGEAKIVVQDVKTYEEMRESLALLKMLSISSNNLRKNKYKTAKNAFESIDHKIRNMK
jgi:prevent-host-death family protein